MKTEIEKRDEPQGEALGIFKGLALELNFPKMPRFDLKGAQGRTLILSIFLFTFSFLILPSIASAGVIRKPPNNLGLTGYWALDDGAVGTSGGVAGDSSGNRRNGLLTVTSLFGPPGWTLGKRGNAIFFDGLNDIILTNVLGNQFFSTATGTVSLWVKPTGTSPTAANANDAARIFGSVTSLSLSAGISRGVVGGLDRIWAFNYSGGNTQVGVSYTNDAWTHIVLVHASSTLYIYKDGVLGGSVASGLTTSLGLAISFGASSSANFFAGTIDEVRTYSRALEPADIAYLYQSGSTKIGFTNPSPGTLANGLTGYWTFDGKDMVSNVADVSGNGNTGYLVNYPATTTAPGAVGQALGFRSASSQYVNIPNASGNLSPGTGNFATSFWYKGEPSGTFFAGNGDSSDGEWDIGFVGGVGKFFLWPIFLRDMHLGTSLCRAILIGIRWYLCLIGARTQIRFQRMSMALPLQ